MTNPDSFLTLSASKLAKLIREEEATSVEIVEAHIHRIQRVNPSLNAVVQTRFNEAREEARQADEKVRTSSDPFPPFLGVPCTIKENFAYVGFPQTSGLLRRKDAIAIENAPTVNSISESGAIPLGTTNVPELAMWMETYNKVYGRTNNPYDAKRIVGGSSGGEGAIIGSGGSPFGLGADIGGSIRLPAFFNGVCGHKPSPGLVPNVGQYPEAENEAQEFLCTGPLTRRAEDLMPLLNVLSDPSKRSLIGSETDVSLEDLTVFDVASNGKVRVCADLQLAQRKCADYLRTKGAKVIQIAIEDLKYSFDIWAAMMETASDTSFAKHMGGDRPVNGFKELGQWIFRKSDFTIPAIGLAVVESLVGKMPNRVEEALEKGKLLRNEIHSLLAKNAVMLYPPYPVVAPKHDWPFLFRTFHFSYTAIFNIMLVPVTQIPLGLNRQGLPLGVQIVGGPNKDHLTIAVGKELEKGFGGWVFPNNL